MAADASRVVFAFPDADGQQQIYALTMDGKKRTPLSEGAFDAYPRFSPDGRWLALASTREGNFDIYVMRSGGGQPYRLTEHPGMDTRPAWSPDGRRIAFTSLRDGNYDIYIINADGSGLQRVTRHEERDDFACWHPDGKQLVAVCQRQGQEDLYLLRVPD
jgi:TolB protein